MAYDGKEAYDIIEKSYFEMQCGCPDCQPIKLILMDYSMPNMNGDQAFILIKKFLTENNLKWIPFITMTAFVEPEYRATMENLGVDFYMNKPLRAVKLRNVVRNLLEGKPAEDPDEID